jgi:predicted nucleic acid-binding protein
LALELGISIVLLDEMDVRKEAESLHLEVRGTLGILERWAKLGKINFRQADSQSNQETRHAHDSSREVTLESLSRPAQPG